MSVPLTKRQRTYLWVAMHTTGAIVGICVDLGQEDLAANFAAQGLRAARMLGLYQ